MGRTECAAYLLAAVGEVPRKSACSCCPFPNGVRGCGRSGDMLERYRAFPDDCAETMFLEYVAAALNPRMTLYPGGKSILQVTQEEDNGEALSRFAERLAAATWALYRVRRIYYAPGRADRSVERISEGSRDTCQAALETIATISSKTIERSGVGQHPRVYLRRPSTDGPFPRLEEQFVLAPGDRSQAHALLVDPDGAISDGVTGGLAERLAEGLRQVEIIPLFSEDGSDTYLLAYFRPTLRLTQS